MNALVKQLEAEAAKLPLEERLRLVDRILASIQSCEPLVESAWSDEIKSRIAAFDRGEYTTYDSAGLKKLAADIAREGRAELAKNKKRATK